MWREGVYVWWGGGRLSKLTIVVAVYYLHVLLYQCMYVCIYVCMHVCMYVCMYACMYVCNQGHIRTVG